MFGHLYTLLLNYFENLNTCTCARVQFFKVSVQFTKILINYWVIVLASLTIFSTTHIPILVPRFFSAAKKHFVEEFKNGHLLHVQNQNLMRSFK